MNSNSDEEPPGEFVPVEYKFMFIKLFRDIRCRNSTMSCKKGPFLKRRVLVPPQVTDLTNVSDNKLMFYQHVMQHSIIFP